jgi:hypothetical protein
MRSPHYTVNVRVDEETIEILDRLKKEWGGQMPAVIKRLAKMGEKSLQLDQLAKIKQQRVR